MNRHDEVVLEVAYKELSNGAEHLLIGSKVEASKKIVSYLKIHFPDRDIRVNYEGHFFTVLGLF